MKPHGRVVYVIMILRFVFFERFPDVLFIITIIENIISITVVIISTTSITDCYQYIGDTIITIIIAIVIISIIIAIIIISIIKVSSLSLPSTISDYYKRQHLPLVSLSIP